MILPSIFREYPLFQQEKADKAPRQTLIGLYLLHRDCLPRKAPYEPCLCPQAPQKKWLHSPPTQELLKLQYLHNSILGSRVHLKNYGNHLDAIYKNAHALTQIPLWGMTNHFRQIPTCREESMQRQSLQHYLIAKDWGKKQKSLSAGDWLSELPVPGLHVHIAGDLKQQKNKQFCTYNMLSTVYCWVEEASVWCVHSMLHLY